MKFEHPESESKWAMMGNTGTQYGGQYWQRQAI